MIYFFALTLDRSDGRPVTHLFEMDLSFNPADLPEGDDPADVDSENRMTFVRRCLDLLGYKFDAGQKVQCNVKVYATDEARTADLPTGEWVN